VNLFLIKYWLKPVLSQYLVWRVRAIGFMTCLLKLKLESDLIFGTNSNSGTQNLYFRRTIPETKFPIPFTGTRTERGRGGVDKKN
jgi:hypothetical protein